MNAYFSSTPMKILGGLTLFMVLLALGSYASLNFEQMKYLDPMAASISVTGEGEVVAVPDVGQFTFSVEATAPDAAAAQEMSGTKINDILAFLKESGVEERDIVTANYNLYPNYRFEERVCLPGTLCAPGEQVADGFTVNQSVQVKIRATDTASAIITGVGTRGATNISGLDFVVDDIDTLMVEARALAIANAKEQAVALSNDLGVRIVKLMSYYEEDPRYAPEPYQMRTMAFEESASDFVAPELPMGESKTTARVTITYEVR